MIDIGNLLIHSLAASLICLTLFQAAREGGILHPLALIIEIIAHLLPEKLHLLYKPFFGCMMCMCSVWGTAYFLLIYGGGSIKEWALIVLASGAFNYLLNLIAELIESIILIHKHESFQWADGADKCRV